MMPEISGDLNDSGAEEIVNLAQFDDESNDVYEASLSPSTIADVQPANQTKVDANFFNKFDDDFDESDMKPTA
ncbi:hypothetical protein Ndes2526B_g04230 [Nannochloris sp. 'desiccata']|nr:hypothetical protein KSW81_000999 [Chlorella desiccata (nom. nud.)]KAH7620311.1 hypothetical protein NADE_002938 [Chlorella desiccata (nom. nud.)]